MELNNGYQNIYLNGLDISLGGTVVGLKEQIRDILPNKIAIVSGVIVGSEKKLPIGVEVKKYITYTEEPEDWDEDEQGEFVPEEVYNLEIKNLYGYDLTIVDNVVTSVSNPVVGVADIEAGTIDNAKPIYCHPIYINMYIPDTTKKFDLTFLIFNNVSTPFADFGEFFDYISDLINNYNAVIMCSGGMGDSSLSRCLIATNVKKSITDTIAVHGILTTTQDLEYFTITKTGQIINSFVDGVNKIN